MDRHASEDNHPTNSQHEDNLEEVKVEIKVDIKEEEDHDVFIKQEIKEKYDEDYHNDDYGHDLRLVKKEEVSDDDANSMQIDDPANADEVISPNLTEPKDIVSRDQLNTATNSVNFELSPSANCQMQLTNSSQIEQSVDQQVDKADHEPYEPANHGHNQWPTTKQSKSRTRKRTAMTSGQVSMNGPMTNSKRTRVETDLHRTETVQEVSTAVAVDERQVDEQSGGGGGGLGQIEVDETELGQEEGGHYKMEIVKLKCTEKGCEDELASREELNDHLRTKHHISPYRCLDEGCKERFKQWNELGSHVRDNHSNISTWPCTHCTKTFKSHHRLYYHLYNYHFEGQFKCDYDGCHYDRVARFRSEIKTHQLSVHPKTTIYTCQFNNCDKSFNKKSNFDNHQRIHQGIKPYKCTWSMCGYSATTQSAVIKHIRTQHFHLPATQKKQRELGIDDNRNPYHYFEHQHNPPI